MRHNVPIKFSRRIFTCYDFLHNKLKITKMDVGQKWFMTPLLVVSSLLAIVANALLLLVFFKRRGLRTISNRFVINLLVTNLLSSVLLVPLMVVDQRHSSDGELFISNSTDASNVTEKIENILIDEKQEKIYGTKVIETEDIIEIDILSNVRAANESGVNFLCYFARTVTNLVCTASIFSILLIGIDQYFAVIHALRYHSYIDKFKSTVLLISCWLFSVVIAALDIVISPDSSFWKFCQTDSEYRDDPATRPSLKIAYSFLYFVAVILGPFVTICIIYVCIYFAARKNSERMRKSTSSGNAGHSNSYNQLQSLNKESSDESLNEIVQVQIPKVRSAPNIVNLEHLNGKRVTRCASDRSNRNLIVTLKSKISNASVFKYREETRAARISILVIFMVLICYIPYGLAVILNTDVYSTKRNYNFNYVSLLLLVLSNFMSPFLFAYRNKRIRRELLKFLRLLPKKQTDQQSPQRTPRRCSSTDNLNRVMQCEKVPPEIVEPFLSENQNFQLPELGNCKVENEKKSILKRVCSKTWTYKKCNFITVPDSCLDARGSFSSASTQISTEE